MTAILALAIALGLMLIELRISLRNERALHQRGAIAPPDPVYAAMRWAYPGVFVLMAAEGTMAGTTGSAVAVLGGAVFAAAKVFKAWAVLTLGERWTFRVLVLPGAPLVTHGPYRLMRHPNYLAVIGELIGFALFVGAPITGILAVLGFGELLRRRIQAEERALGIYFPEP